MIEVASSTLKKEEVMRLFDGISVWKRGGDRAPHKPLLALIALGKCCNSGKHMISYEEVEPQLREVLSNFGPPRQVCHPEYPFWRLQNDGIWTVHADGPLERVKGSTDPKKSELIKQHAKGGFSPPLFNALQSDPQLVQMVADRLLNAHFPASLHTDILNAVGLPICNGIGTPRVRDAEFRAAVIRAYQHRCAICGYDIRLGNSDIGIEAAHIKWYQAGGPDVVPNGLCLCVMHHRVFDRGAIGVSRDGRLLISEEVHGGIAVDEWLLRFEGKQLRKPQRKGHIPNPEFVEWHTREVFRSPARETECELNDHRSDAQA